MKAVKLTQPELDELLRDAKDEGRQEAQESLGALLGAEREFHSTLVRKCIREQKQSIERHLTEARECIISSMSKDGTKNTSDERGESISSSESILEESDTGRSLIGAPNRSMIGVKKNSVTFDGLDEDDQDDVSQSNEDRTQRNTIFDDLGLTGQDHFTLKAPSSSVKINDTQYHVFALKRSQFILEKQDESEIAIARVAKDTSNGLNMIRSFYALVACLMTGFLFVFSVQINLFLFLGLAVDSGLTSAEKPANYLKFIARVLSLPNFLQGLASLLAMATSYVIDTYNGSPFINNIFGVLNIATNWISFLVYLVIPLLVASITLYLRLDDWWATTALTWLTCVFVAFLIFIIFAIHFELSGCLELARNHPNFKDVSNGRTEAIFAWDTIKRAILIRQRQKYAAYKTETFFVKDRDPSRNRYTMTTQRKFLTVSRSLNSRVKTSPIILRSGFYKEIDQPTRMFTINEVRNQSLLQTAETWNLEKMYCFGDNSRVVSVMKGSSALLPEQVRSSFVCSLIGYVLPVILVSAILAWLELPLYMNIIAVVLVVLCSVGTLRSSMKLYKMYKDMKGDEYEGTVFQVKRTLRIANPRERLCFTLVVVENIFFFLIPLISLYIGNNLILAGFFTVISVINSMRTYLNVADMLKEIGSLDGLEDNNKGVQKHEDWLEKHRLSWIVSKFSQGRRVQFWYKVFTFFILLFCFVVLGATAIGQNQGLESSLAVLDTPLDDFYYPENKFLRYPTCQLGGSQTKQTVSSSDLAEPRMTSQPSHFLTLPDYVFLSNLAYLSKDITQRELDYYFGEGVAVDNIKVKETFQKEYAEALEGERVSDVVYKLIDFPDMDMAIVSIRGTLTGWDALADAQLWCAAFLTQLVLLMVPFGEIWNPIAETIILLISVIESGNMENVAYYKETTKFVQKLQKEGKNVRLTGHSLGGGLAMISGAQTNTAAVAISGPNNSMSRKSFSPQLTLDQIDEYMFNVVPARDIVPMIDKPGLLTQNVRCTAPVNSLAGCHSVERTFCEVQYNCGSGNRPVYCGCHRMLGYDKPLPTGTSNRTFEEACPDEL